MLKADQTHYVSMLKQVTISEGQDDSDLDSSGTTLL